jgi:hypothetical protein
MVRVVRSGADDTGAIAACAEANAITAAIEQFARMISARPKMQQLPRSASRPSNEH